MAEVFKAKAFGVEGFERLLAIKRILPNIAEDAEFIEMFVDEAKIAVELHHANVAQIYDLGRIDGSYFIAMEYIHGKDMRAIFDRSRKFGESVAISMACYLIMKICEGIDYAHNKRDSEGREMGLVHRDISPQNILVSYEGEVKIIDFGIAKAANKASKTQAGILKGKFGYMSPEQVRGLPLDRRSDIFSVGIVLYELLTGERLFLGESDFSTLEKVRNVEIMPPTLHNPKIPEELESIVFKALAKNVDERYEHAIDLHDDLQRFLYGMNSFFSRKDLAQYMKRAFSEELAKENAQIDAYRKMQPPAMGGGYNESNNGYNQQPQGSLADAFAAAAQPSRRNPTPFPSSPQSGQGSSLSSRRTPLPGTITPPPVSPSRRTPPLGMSSQPDPQNDPFRSGFIGSLPPKSTGNTQIVSEADFVEEEHSSNGRDSFFAAARNVQQAQHNNEPDILDQLAQRLPPRPIPPHLPPLGELLAPDAIPPMTNLPRKDGLDRGKLVALLAVGFAVAVLAVGAYFLFGSKPQSSLTIITSPTDAKIYIDNERLEQTSPATKLLPIGLHTIKVMHNDFEATAQDVELQEGKAQKLQITLKPKDTGAGSNNTNATANQGKLYIDSDPPGAQILIDGLPHPSKTPTIVDGLAFGAHSVKVLPVDTAMAPYFVPSIEIKPGADVPVVKAKFGAARGTLNVNSTPDGASVLISISKEKKNLRGTTPAVFDDLPMGVELEVFVERNGFNRFSKKLTLENTDPISIDAVLTETAETPKDPKKDPPIKDPKKDPLVKDPVVKDPVVEPPSSGPGFLTAGSSPSTECIVDGKSMGFTPCVKLELKPGKHTVKFKLQNDTFDIDDINTVEIKSGEIQKLNKKFSPKAP